MDREQEEMQFLGLFGICLESYKIIISWRKIFSKITLSLLLPLSFIFLAHIEVSNLLFFKILRHEIQLDDAQQGTKRYNKLSDLISSEWTTFWLFKFAYFVSLLVFSLLSTAAVVYTIATVYTARQLTFRKVMSVVPKVWKRLMVTFLCAFLTFLIYNAVTILVFVLVGLLFGYSNAGAALFTVVIILYALGFVYMTVVWHLASVVSVLEDNYGFRAMMKSKDLIKGNLWIAVVIFFTLNLSLWLIERLFNVFVVYAWADSLISKVGFGILCLLLLCKLFLFGLVVQTVIYFVCKSYHHENIDKSSLSDHLEVYLGDYVALKSKDVQLEHFDV